MTDEAQSLPEEVLLYQRWAKARIEAMSDRPPAYSRTAYTSRRTEHTVFIYYSSSLDESEAGDAAQKLVDEVRAYRDAVKAPQLLVWRCEPEFLREADRWKLYARLCFETDLERIRGAVGEPYNPLGDKLLRPGLNKPTEDRANV